MQSMPQCWPGLSFCPLTASAEAELVLWCARTTLERQASERIEALIQTGLDWDEVQRLAHVQKVWPLLCHNLECSVPELLSEAAALQMATLRYKLSSRNKEQLVELAAVLEKFRAHGLRALAYKGPVFAEVVYGGMGLRACYDIDLLIHPHDFATGVTLLLANGYELTMPLSWKHHLRRPMPYDGNRPSCAVGSDAAFIDVDLHRAIIPRWYGVETAFDGLWQRRSNVLVDGASFSTPCAEDMLIVLCLDLTKDIAEGKTFLKLVKVTDIFEQLRSCPAIDWRQVIERSGAIGAERMVMLGLHVVSTLYGVALPEFFRLTHRRIGWRDRLGRYTIRSVLASSARRSPESLARLREIIVVLRLQQDLGRRLRVLGEIADYVRRHAGRSGGGRQEG